MVIQESSWRSYLIIFLINGIETITLVRRVDEGTPVLKASTWWNILHNRKLIFNLVWTPIAFLLMWLALTTPWVFFLVSAPGLISLFLGFSLSSIVQVYSSLGWSARLPLEIPPREKRRFHWWELLIFMPLYIILTFVTWNGIAWLQLNSPIGLWIVVTLAAGFVTFILCVLVPGFWPSLLAQLYWEHREGKTIVKQDNYWVGEGNYQNEQRTTSKITEER